MIISAEKVAVNDHDPARFLRARGDEPAHAWLRARREGDGERLHRRARRCSRWSSNTGSTTTSAIAIIEEGRRAHLQRMKT
jgi:hypothetical protein